jgi:hypothetical protein
MPIHLFLYLYLYFYPIGQRVHYMSSPGHCILGFTWWAVVILFGSYTGNLVAFLTVVKVSPPFTDLEELAAQSQYKFGTLGGTMWEQTFKVPQS